MEFPAKIRNPILKGSNPDPSIIRAGEDYYIATSTFEWWPGVQIHHSRDLVHWRLHSRPLNRISQLQLAGVPDSGGVWAPCLSYNDGTFYLVVTNVKAYGVFMQCDNYLFTTADINGDWSEPVYLNSLGFDPSLFHDTDGRKWLLNLDAHYQNDKRFNGLVIREYDSIQKKLVGKTYKIYDNPKTELVEGAHLYHIGGYYYLMKAQGGTGTWHSAQLSRSRSLFGPYEDCPEILLHARNAPHDILQKAGHADIVETQNGEWYLVHLSTSWTCDEDYSTLGRETSIQKIEWTDDGWLRLSADGNLPQTEVPAPALPPHPFGERSRIYDFSTGVLDVDFQTLRTPLDADVLSFDENGLCLRGGAGLSTLFSKSLVAVRLEKEKSRASTQLAFEPEWEKHMAGLTLYYNSTHYYYLYMTRNNETGKKELVLLKCDKGEAVFYPSVEINERRAIVLTADIDRDRVQFSFRYADEKAETSIETPQDMNILTDEYVGLYAFTGTFIGIACQDLENYTRCAHFKWLAVEQEEEKA